MFRIAVIILWIASITLPARAAVRVDVNYRYIVHEIQPEIKEYSNTGGTSFVLDDGGRVTLVSSGGVSTNGIDGYVTGINKNGVKAIVHFRISNGSITEFYENEYVRETINVRLKGSDFCEASVKARPPAGQRYVIGINPTKYISHQDAINVVCSIKKI